MEKRYESMTFAIENYRCNNTDEEAREAMWQDIAKFLYILTKNEYVSVVYDDETDIIVIQYEHNERRDAWGCANPRWITDDEMWQLKSMQEDVYEDDCPEEYTAADMYDYK